MRLEDIEVGSMVDVVNEDEKVRTMLLSVIYGERYYFIREQDEGGYILEYIVRKGLIEIDDDILSFQTKKSILTVLKPSDSRYANLNKKLRDVNLFTGTLK